MAAHACLNNEFTEDETYHNLMTWLICKEEFLGIHNVGILFDRHKTFTFCGQGLEALNRSCCFVRVRVVLFCFEGTGGMDRIAQKENPAFITHAPFRAVRL